MSNLSILAPDAKRIRNIGSLALLAFAHRFVIWSWTYVIGADGPVYVDAAKKFLVGDFDGAYGSLLPPLYSLLVGCVASHAGNLETSAYFISMIASSLLIVPLFLLVENVWNYRIACCSSLVYAFHPMLALEGTEVSTTGLFLGAFIAALCCGVLALRGQSWALYPGFGLAAGLCFLTRPEGVLLPLILVVGLILRIVHEIRLHSSIKHTWTVVTLRSLRHAAGVFVATACIAAVIYPYLVWVRAYTGTWALTARPSAVVLWRKLRTSAAPNPLKTGYLQFALNSPGPVGRSFSASPETSPLEVSDDSRLSTGGVSSPFPDDAQSMERVAFKGVLCSEPSQRQGAPPEGESIYLVPPTAAALPMFSERRAGQSMFDDDGAHARRRPPSLAEALKRILRALYWPLLPFLLIGFITARGQGGSRSLTVCTLLIAGCSAAPSLALYWYLSVHFPSHRYFLLALVLVLPWIASGILTVFYGIHRFLGVTPEHPRYKVLVIGQAALIALILLGKSIGPRHAQDLPLLDAGLWLQTQDLGPWRKIIDHTGKVGYYARCEWEGIVQSYEDVRWVRGGWRWKPWTTEPRSSSVSNVIYILDNHAYSRGATYVAMDTHSIKLLQDAEYLDGLQKADFELVKTFTTPGQQPGLTVWIYKSLRQH
jgi:hypothetical protein